MEVDDSQRRQEGKAHRRKPVNVFYKFCLTHAQPIYSYATFFPSIPANLTLESSAGTCPLAIK
jgi:hypothetical protein